MPQRDSAAELRMYSWPPRTSTTGFCGATRSRSSRSGSRCSLSCASCQSLFETITSPGFDAWTRACSAASTSAIDRARDRSTPGPPPAPCRWLSIRPGITARPFRSIIRVAGSGDGLHLIVVADGHDPIADDRDRLVNREAAIDGDDLAVEEHEIGRRRARQESGRCAASAAVASTSDQNATRITRGSIFCFSPSIRPSKLRGASLVSGRSTESAAILTRWRRAPAPGVDDTAAQADRHAARRRGRAEPRRHDESRRAFDAGLVATYAWFIGVAFITWEANLRLYLLFQDRTAWLTRPWHRVRLLVGLICLFTIPFTGSALWLWAALFQDPNATWRSIAMAVITIVAAVTFITHVYETLFLVREWESDRERGEQLQRLNVEAELLALKSEVNPHTLFNNLNALSHLVEQRHPRAAAFVGALAEQLSLPVEDGLEAAGAARRRAGAARSVPVARDDPLCGRAEGEVHVDAHAAARWQIPPVVLPELLENAVKHNEFYDR